MAHDERDTAGRLPHTFDDYPVATRARVSPYLLNNTDERINMLIEALDNCHSSILTGDRDAQRDIIRQWVLGLDV